MSSRAGEQSVLRPAQLSAHMERLTRTALSLTRCREDAEDLVQETFARILRRPRVLHGNELNYLLRALHNTWVSDHRVRLRHPLTQVLDEDHDEIDDAVGDPCQRVDLCRAMATLPDRYRQTLVAVDVLGLTYRQAAVALDVRHGTVMSRLSRARSRIVAQIDLAA